MNDKPTLMLILGWIVFGGAAGLVARVVFRPGPRSMGWTATIGLGVAGSFVGGMLVNLALGGRLFSAHTAGWAGSLAGAFLVLAAVCLVRQHRFAR